MRRVQGAVPFAALDCSSSSMSRSILCNINPPQSRETTKVSRAHGATHSRARPFVSARTLGESVNAAEPILACAPGAGKDQRRSSRHGSASPPSRRENLRLPARLRRYALGSMPRVHDAGQFVPDESSLARGGAAGQSGCEGRRHFSTDFRARSRRRSARWRAADLGREALSVVYVGTCPNALIERSSAAVCPKCGASLSPEFSRRKQAGVWRP